MYWPKFDNMEYNKTKEVVARSSVKAEYRCMPDPTAEFVWLNYILDDSMVRYSSL